MIMKETYILYHASCFDGFGAAFASFLHLGDSAEYIPVAYGKPFPEIPDNSIVYIVDFSYPKEVLENLRKRVKFLKVIDHHKTAEAELKDLPYCIFDMTKSGALLTHEYFCRNHPTLRLEDRQYTEFFRYISDRDLWTFKLPKSREVHAALSSYPKDFKVWMNLTVPDLIKEGGPILRHIETTVKMMCDDYAIHFSNKYESLGYPNIPVVNASGYWSEIGEELRNKFPEAPFVCSYFHRGDGKTQWSMRCKSDFDVSEVAKQFGGGGHKEAAGFTEVTKNG
jgi:oligoribonuclease NrnB/cAMP/cGMP phosphodiesterase (DHH superfamily)